jgi:hypothetical protein
MISNDSCSGGQNTLTFVFAFKQNNYNFPKIIIPAESAVFLILNIQMQKACKSYFVTGNELQVKVLMNFCPLISKLIWKISHWVYGRETKFFRYGLFDVEARPWLYDITYFFKILPMRQKIFWWSCAGNFLSILAIRYPIFMDH